MTHSPSPFMFETEFTPSGDVLKGPDRKFFSREETDQLAVKARQEGEAKARQTAEVRGFASVDKIVAHLAPVSAQLSALAEQLRAEAAELAMIAARRIAGDALDKNGDAAAATAIADVIRQLKLNPIITVSLAAESLPEVERRMEQIRRQGSAANIAFVADAKARPGDWRVEWGEGATGFSREGVEAAIDAIIKARLQDPVAPQLELFSA